MQGITSHFSQRTESSSRLRSGKSSLDGQVHLLLAETKIDLVIGNLGRDLGQGRPRGEGHWTSKQLALGKRRWLDSPPGCLRS